MNIRAPAADEMMAGGRIGSAAGIGVGLLALALLFQSEVSAAVGVWRSSTAFNHCFFVIPIVLFLIWDRRDALRRVWPSPCPLAITAGLPLALAWFVAERVGLMEGRQLVALSFAELLFFVVLGPRLWWMVAGPLLFLYFLVPFGAFLTPTLQDITTAFVAHCLPALHIPIYTDRHTIEIPEGSFLISKACAGLRFLIAAVAFGCLYALLMFRSAPRRAAFIGLSVIVPVLANGVRACCIVALGHYLGSVKAVETDHVLYGWIFFSAVILILAMLGLPFRQDRSPCANWMSQRSPRAESIAWPLLMSVAGVLALAAIGPAGAAQLDRNSDRNLNMPRLNSVSECVSQPMSSTMSLAGQMAVREFGCDQGRISLAIEVFSPRSTAARLATEQRRLMGDVAWEDLETSPIPNSNGLWTLWRTVTPPRVIATGIWVGGKPTSLDLMARVHMAWCSIFGGPFKPVLIELSADTGALRADTPDPESSAALLVDFVRTHPTLSALASRLAYISD